MSTHSQQLRWTVQVHSLTYTAASTQADFSINCSFTENKSTSSHLIYVCSSQWIISYVMLRAVRRLFGGISLTYIFVQFGSSLCVFFFPFFRPNSEHKQTNEQMAKINLINKELFFFFVGFHRRSMGNCKTVCDFHYVCVHVNSRSGALFHHISFQIFSCFFFARFVHH